MAIGARKRKAESGIAEVFEKARKKSKRKKPDGAKRRRQQHKVELLFLVSECMIYNAQCENAGLQRAAAETVADPFQPDTQGTISLKKLKSLHAWFHKQFSESQPAESNVRYTNLGRLPGVIEKMRGSLLELAQVFTLIVRYFQIPCRLVFCLFPRDERNRSSSAANRVSTCERANVWCEVWIQDEAKNGEATGNLTGRWVHVGIKDNLIDKPQFYHTPMGSGFTGRKILSNEAWYILGISQCDYIVDVTRRYVSSYSSVRKRRLAEPNISGVLACDQFNSHAVPGENQSTVDGAKPSSESNWWESEVLQKLRQNAKERLLLEEQNYAKQAFEVMLQSMSHEGFAQEMAELESHCLAEDLPSSEAGFKLHAKYVLVKHLLQHQCIHPDATHKALHKGQKVYLRSSIHRMFSARQWMLKGRDIDPKEHDKPVKTVKIKHTSNSFYASKRAPGRHGGTRTNAKEASDEGLERKRELYGEWQTIEMERPKLISGKIPVNNYNNIEIYHDRMIPELCAHVASPYAARVAKRLKLQYVPAVVGFDRGYPTVNGVVILQEHESTVADGARELEIEAAKAAQEKRFLAVVEKWAKLVNGWVHRHRIHAKYSGRNRQEEGAVHAIRDAESSQSVEPTSAENFYRPYSRGSTGLVYGDDMDGEEEKQNHPRHTDCS